MDAGAQSAETLVRNIEISRATSASAVSCMASATMSASVVLPITAEWPLWRFVYRRACARSSSSAKMISPTSGCSLTEQRVALGAQDDGRLDALIHTGLVVMTEHNNMPEPFILPARSAYAAGSFKLDVETTTLDMLANTFMRAPGEAVGTFGLESGIDELAYEIKMDPIELRIRNEPDKDPTTGAPFSSRHIVEAYRAGAERFG